MEIFNKLFQKARTAYQKADKAAGGWLPGGGTASPITKAVLPAQTFPGRSKELERQTGVKARITPLNNNSISDKIPYLKDIEAYANPFLNNVRMRNYKGGKNPRERYVEHHELGHIYGGDDGWTRFVGSSGRLLKDFSVALGNVAPLDVGAGLAMQHFDAAEEDRAERFAAKWAEAGNYPAPNIYEDKTSDYGNGLRKQGKEMVSSGVERITNPYGIRTKVETFINTQRAKPLQEELTRSLSAYRQTLDKNNYQDTPETLAETKRLSDIAKKIEALGLEPQY